MSKLKTEIIVISDRSGSMLPMATEVIGGYNNFLKSQKEVPGKAKVTYVQFDNEYELIYEGRKLAEAPELTPETYQPRGMTALYDAIGRTLISQQARIESEKWADLVVVCIITDGVENSSQEINISKLNSLINESEARGWKFVYLAANQNAFAVAHAMGMKNAMVTTYDSSSVGWTTLAYGTINTNVTKCRVDYSAGDNHE